jgi:hypothetical protein
LKCVSIPCIMRGVKIRSLELFLEVKVYHERLYYLALAVLIFAEHR